MSQYLSTLGYFPVRADPYFLEGRQKGGKILELLHLKIYPVIPIHHHTEIIFSGPLGSSSSVCFSLKIELANNPIARALSRISQGLKTGPIPNCNFFKIMQNSQILHLTPAIFIPNFLVLFLSQFWQKRPLPKRPG